MWRQPATQANVRALRARGVAIVGPESGRLASGLSGPGRLHDLLVNAEAVTPGEYQRSGEGLTVRYGFGRPAKKVITAIIFYDGQTPTPPVPQPPRTAVFSQRSPLPIGVAGG